MKKNNSSFSISAVAVLVFIFTLLCSPQVIFAQGGGITYLEITGETNPDVLETKTYSLNQAAQQTVTWSVSAGGEILSSTQTTCEVRWDVAGTQYVQVEESGSGLPIVLMVNVASSTGSTPGTIPTITRALNLARSYQVKAPGMDNYQDITEVITPDSVFVQSGYFDGLGRPQQTVAQKLTPDQKDFVSETEYDALGRIIDQYLPYKASTSDGKLKIGTTDRESFYDTQYGTSETHPYSSVSYETSPLNRPLENTGPGKEWHNNSKSVTTAYAFNSTDTQYNEEVIKWKVTDDQGVIVTKEIGLYGANELMVTTTTDEQGNQVKEYTNERGQVILKKVQEALNPGANHTGWLATYYVYDDLQQLIRVIPPLAVEKHINEGTSDNLNQDIVNNLCFQYSYDHRGRMITKRVPGTNDVTEMVYDKLNRPVLSRDARQKAAGEWVFTRYDALSRPVMTGIYKSNSDRATLQAEQNNASAFDLSYLNPPVSGNQVDAEILIVDHHIDGVTLYEAKEDIIFTGEMTIDAATDGTVDAEINAGSTATGNYLHGYQDPAKPVLDEQDRIQTVSYYDHYDFTDKTFDNSYNSAMTVGSFLEVPEALATAQGQATGSRTRIFGTDQWLESVIFYDKRGRVIQTQGENHKGGTDIVTNVYDFSGKLIYTYTHHKNPAANDFTELRVLKKLTYDHADRLIKVESRNVNQESNYTIIAEHSYDDLSQLSQKKLGNAHQTVDYDYNIRGWMTDINDVSALGSDYFAMQLQYTAAGQHNGNIGAIDWKSAGDTDLKTYTYSYDKVNRLTAAVFDNANGTTYDNDYNMSATYDANGNILTLNRKGRVLNTAEDIDLLSYTYAANSNQLTKVTDTGDAYDIGDFKDGTNTGDDYSYDANGNLTKDENKDITGISYNQLNLPELITFTGNRSISFVYDAAGIKLQKIKNDNGVLTTTDYISGFIYEGNNLQHFAHEEGRVRKNDAGSLVYDYVIKDHLGNARSTFTTETAPALIYKATMESDNDLDGNNIKAYEETFFYNLENSRVSLPTAANVSTTSDDQCTNCNESAAVNGQTNPIGPAIILDVMPGDEIDLEVWAYRSENVTTSTGTISQANFIDALTEAFTPGGVASELGMQTEAIFNPIYTSLRGGSGSGSTLPKAYLNYVVFNQNFVKQTQGHQPVNGSLNISSLISLNNINITQKGYIYIWVSNESDANLDVFFDDLKVTHTKGHILQEDHYYPFGMNINALSSSAPLSKPNHYKFNGNEEQVDFDLRLMDFNARFYDPIIGRFIQVDPLSEKVLDWTPFRFGFNNPINVVDPTGLIERQIQAEDGTWWTVDCDGTSCDNARKSDSSPAKQGCDLETEDCDKAKSKNALVDPYWAVGTTATAGKKTTKKASAKLVAKYFKFFGVALAAALEMFNSHDTGHYAALWSDEMQQELNRLQYLKSQGKITDEEKRILNWLLDRYDYFMGGGVTLTFGENFSKKVRKHIDQVRKRYEGTVDDIPSPGKGGIDRVQQIIMERIAQGGGYAGTYAGEPATFYTDGGVVYVVRESGEFWTILRNTKE